MHSAPRNGQQREKNSLHRCVNEAAHDEESGAEAEEDGRRENGLVGSLERGLAHAQDEEAEDGEEEEDVAGNAWLLVGGGGKSGCGGFCFCARWVDWEREGGGLRGGGYLIGLLRVRKSRGGCRDMLLVC